MKNIKTILVLAPHPDDGEFGAGASLVKWASEGIEIHYYAFSPCIKSLPAGYKDDALFNELKAAAKIIGIPQDHIHIFNFPVREFPKYRQEILENLIQMRKKINPDLVLMPNSQDIHQDHNVIYNEGVRAFKSSRMLGYELPWNSLNFTSNFHVKVNKTHIAKKSDAIKAYSTQKDRPYSDVVFLEGLARVRGVQVNTEFAEAFECIRWME